MFQFLKNKQPWRDGGSCTICTRGPIEYSAIRLLILLLIILIGFSACSHIVKANRKDDTFVVVVDAGHGGNDPGKVGGDILEKDINLSIARITKRKFEEAGIEVVMTRENDANLALDGARNKKTSDMKNRIDVINGANADLLISIHQNSFTDASVCGAQVFYYEDSKDGKEFANILQQELKIGVDSKNRRTPKAGNDYYIIRKSVCPGVILECGFLSCPEETSKLISSEYQEKIADAIVKSVLTYKKSK